MSPRAPLRCIAAIAILQATALVANPSFASLVIETVGVPATQTFNGTQTTLTMPSGWRLFTTLGSPTFAGGTTPTPTVLAGAAIATAGSGIYGFRDGSSTDRSLGFLVGNSPARNIIVEIRNITGGVLDSLTASWNLEKYRNGEASLPISFFHSSDGMNWTESSEGGFTYAADINFNALPSPTSTAKSVTLAGLAIPHSQSYYLRWQFIKGPEGTLSAGVGLDNFSVTGAAAVPEASAFLATGAAGLVSWFVLRSRRTSAAGPEDRHDG
jgi:hypothetical protein